MEGAPSQDEFNKLHEEALEVDKELDKEKNQERKLIAYINQLIIEGKVAQHSAYYLVKGIIEDLEMTPEELQNEKSRNNSHNRGHFGMSLQEKLKTFKSYFEDGILSNRKLARRTNPDNKYPYDGGFGLEFQTRTKEFGEIFISALHEYFKKKKESKTDLESLKYEESINSEEFSDILLDVFKERDYRSEHYKESERKIRYDGFKEKFLSAPQSRFAFNLYKKEAWKKKINSGMKDEFSPDAIETLADLLYGSNLISSYPPTAIKKDYEKTGKLREYHYDVLSILFRVSNKMKTFVLGKESDLGVINRIPPEDFVAVVVNENIKQLPPEIIGTIPGNIPIITTDFKVIRLPKGEKEN